MSRLLHDKKFQNTGIADDLHSRLNFGQEEITPGWQLKFGLRTNRMSYTLMVTPTDAATFPALATDERGLIYQGKALEWTNAQNSTAATTLRDSTPITHSAELSQSRIKSAIKALALGPDYNCTGCEVCGGRYPCCCPVECCTCSTWGDYGTPECVNCGCTECVWCCC